MRYPSFDEHHLSNFDFISHYTSASIGIEKILYEGKLRISKKNNTDDPIENKNYEFIPSVPNNTEIAMAKKFQKDVSSLLATTRILCFCKNQALTEKDELFSFHKGYIRPRMWSQYGDHQKGICFVFSKEKLSAILIKKKYPDYEIFKKDVYYDNKVSLQRSIYTIENRHYSSDPLDFIKTNRDVYFFSKVKDYRDESEFRIVLLERDKKKNDEEVFVDYKDSLVGVVCGEKLHHSYIPAIKSLTQRSNIPVYKMTWDYGIPNFQEI